MHSIRSVVRSVSLSVEKVSLSVEKVCQVGLGMYLTWEQGAKMEASALILLKSRNNKCG